MMEERMIGRIADALVKAGADDYEIESVHLEGREFYFIRHRLDQDRAKSVHTVSAKAFRKLDDGAAVGIAQAKIPYGASDEEIEKTARDLVYQAGLAKNPAYGLNEPVDVPEGCGAPSEAAVPELRDMAKDYIEAFAGIPETGTEFINSYEIFVNRVDREFVNSRGISVSQSYPVSQIEVVTNAAEGDHEIELYRLYERGTCDREALTRDVEELLRFGKDRLKAVPTPDVGNAALILSTQDAVQLYEYFCYRMNAANKYMQITDWEIGKPICGSMEGDGITVKAVPVLPGSSKNFTFDEEGAFISERYIMKNSVPETFWGSRRFSSYIGLEDSSIVYNFTVDGGRKPAAELRKEPYLEVVEFSDFQCDEMTGDIAGEIRLGYYFDGEKTIPVTGGSVSGSLRELAGKMHLSSEQRQYDNMVIPEVTRIEGVSFTTVD